jgi:hypothetical protein
MTQLLLGEPLSTSEASRRWSLPGMVRALLSTRREIRKVSVLARRERLQRGYQHIPQRVWDRRSALFIER